MFEDFLAVTDKCLMILTLVYRVDWERIERPARQSGAHKDS